MSEDVGKYRVLAGFCDQLDVKKELRESIIHDSIQFLSSNEPSIMDSGTLLQCCFYLVLLKYAPQCSHSFGLSDYCRVTGIKLENLVNGSKKLVDENESWAHNKVDVDITKSVFNLAEHMTHMNRWFQKFSKLWNVSAGFVNQNASSFSLAWLLFVVSKTALGNEIHEDSVPRHPTGWTCDLMISIVCMVRMARESIVSMFEQLNPDTKRRRIATPSNSRGKALCFGDIYKYMDNQHPKEMDAIFMSATLESVEVHKQNVQAFLDKTFGVEFDILREKSKCEICSWYRQNLAKSLDTSDDTLFVVSHDTAATTTAYVETPQKNILDRDEAIILPPEPPRKLKVDIELDQKSKKTLFFGGDESPRLHPPPQAHVKHVSYQQPLLSPTRTSKCDIPKTPITQALQASNWLTRELGTLAPEPDSQLRGICEACTTDPLPNIVATVETMCNKLRNVVQHETKSSRRLFPDRTHSPTVKHDQQCSVLDFTKRLYYLVLIRIVQVERDKNRNIAFDKLETMLQNISFHRSLFCCCLEVIAVAKESRNKTFRYPASMDVLEIKPINLLCVNTWSFHEAIPRMPDLIDRHLEAIQNHILEKQIWKSGSEIYAEMPYLNSTQPIEKPNSASNRSAYKTLFISILTDLLNSKIKKIVTTLGRILNVEFDTLENDLDTVFPKIILQHTSILTDRHIDTMLICATYGIGKVRKLQPEVSFRVISQAYKDMTEDDEHRLSTDDEVRRQILLDSDTGASGDLIAFYNRVFVPEMKDTILDLKDGTDMEAVGETLEPHGEIRPMITRADHEPVSPVRPVRQRCEMTPKTRVLYADSESPRITRQHLRNRAATRNMKRDVMAADVSPRSTRRQIKKVQKYGFAQSP